jgi:Bacterial capsule synthesis protein PGA_cap
MRSLASAPSASHRVTGITVPHHLVAADLIARGFRCASGGSYERLPQPDADARPFFALLHWGTEFRREATPRQIKVLDWLTGSPVTAIFGAHPHVASGGPEPWRAGDGLVCRSLGNFLFDQINGSGALAEVRFFEDKTFAVRWIPVGNLLKRAAADPRSRSPPSAKTSAARGSACGIAAR